jgi:hypothetical protein
LAQAAIILTGYNPSMPRPPRITLGLILKIVSILLLSSFIIGYVLFQARSFLNGPVITLKGADTVIHDERIILLSGTARNIVKLTLNGREITTDKDGLFSEEMVLENGYSITTLEAHDRFGRRTTLSREYVFIPKELSSSTVLE